MVFILERRRPKVDKSNLGIQQHASLRGLAADVGARRWDFSIVGKGLVLVMAKQDVLGLQISMYEIQIVKD